MSVSEKFTLVLSSAASVAELQRWMMDAQPMARAVYASGLDLVRDAPGVLLVRRWEQRGLVRLFRQRDPADGRRWLFLVEMVGVDSLVSPSSAGRDASASLGCASRDAAVAEVLGRPLGAGAPDGGHLHGHVSCCTMTPETQALQAALMPVLRAAAPSGECPSNAALAQALGLGSGDNARWRVRRLLAQLEVAGAIALEIRGRNAPRGLRIIERETAHG